MKKLKSLFLKMKAKRTLKTYQKPLLMTIMTLLFINLCVLIIASIMGLIIDPAYFEYNFFKAFAHALSCMISANTITKLIDIISTNLGVVILSAIIIAIEMVLFSGAIIATLTTAVRSFIDKKSHAQGKLELQNHFVILNWNAKVPDIVYNLICKGFKNNVLILAEEKREYINTEIESLVMSYATSKRKINIIVKEGSPLLHGNLEDISIDKASQIVIMSKEGMGEGDDINISNTDLYSLKIMLALGNFNISPNCNVVVETETEESKVKLENLAKTLNNFKNKTIIPMSFNKKIGQIIAQTVIEPTMASIYLELLSYEGCEFYSYGEEEVDSFLAKHTDAIPIVKFNKLFVLAEDELDIKHTRVNNINIRKFKTKQVDLSYKCTIFVIGENKKAKFILENLNLATIGYGSKFVVKSYNKNDSATLIEDIKETEGEKRILLLSDDSVSTDSLDSNVFVTLIALSNAFPKREQLSFITELLDSRNLPSVRDFNINNAIISNSMMSLLISQLALNQDSKQFFEGLLTADTSLGGNYFDIAVERVGDVIEDGEDLTFASKAELIQSFYYSLDKKYMLLGYNHNGKNIFIPKGQDENIPITLDKDDKFIMIKY